MTDRDIMQGRMAGLVERYEELNCLLADPDVLADNQRYRKLAKEHADLHEVVDCFGKWSECTTQLADARVLLGESDDPEMRDLAREEVDSLEQQLEELSQTLQVLLLPKDPNDDKDIILEVRAGTGGDEASLFAGDLFRMYQRYCEERKWKMDIMHASAGSVGGFKEVIASVEGQGVFAELKFESGVHRVQRVPSTESQGRIHTSAVTVAVLPEAEDVEINLPEKDLRIDVFRSSGPGGQSVNTTDSAVRITHLPTGLVVSCQDEKSQHKNKAKAIKILRARLYDRMLAEQQAEISEARRAMVRSGDRSEKIRTYNFPQDRVTDHRIGLTLHNLPSILAGDLGTLLTGLRTWYKTEALKGESS